jgi:hypothetical protein
MDQPALELAGVTASPTVTHIKYRVAQAR